MRSQLVLRPDYGAIVPWIEPVPDGALVTAGPDSFHLSTPHPLAVADGAIEADFHAVAGSRMHFVMSWHSSSEPQPAGRERRLRAGPYRGLVERLVGQMHL